MTQGEPMSDSGRPVVVTTKHRGVFFGYAEDTSGPHCTLSQCRNCISWSSSIKGFLGLAVTGPDSNCRIGPAVPSLDIRDITSVAEMTDEAVAAWESAPWS